MEAKPGYMASKGLISAESMCVIRQGSSDGIAEESLAGSVPSLLTRTGGEELS